MWTMMVAQLVNKYPALYTASEFIIVFTASVTGAYPSEIDPIRIPTTHLLKAVQQCVHSSRHRCLSEREQYNPHIYDPFA
jgi:hypothetical protein